ncbi:MAG: B12-binding domain-containing radical SAM protein [Terriglobia bacterium]
MHFVQPYHPAASVKQFGKVYMSSLTIPVLAGAVPPGVEATAVDENVRPIDFELDTDIVCITALTPAATRAYEIADKFRARGVKVVLGGVHPTLMAEEAKHHADSVVLGEAEGIMQDMVDDFRNGGLKDFYEAGLKPDLQTLGRPDRGLFSKLDYNNIPKVETSRGCPFNCNFCSTTVFFGRKMRYRPVKEVIAEIEDIKPSFVFFTDNNIVGNTKYAKQLFRALIPLKIRWISQGSLNLSKDEELLKLAAESGCVGMLIGFESLAQQTLETIGKRVNRSQEYMQAVRKIHGHGIGIIGCFVFGFDEDDKTVFKRTLKFVRRLNIEVPQLTILTPYPGTILREKLTAAGRILHDNWEKYDVTHVVYVPKLMSPEELKKQYNKICRKVYSHWAITVRGLKSFFYLRSWRKLFVFWQVNLVYRKLFLIGAKDKL